MNTTENIESYHEIRKSIHFKVKNYHSDYEKGIISLEEYLIRVMELHIFHEKYKINNGYFQLLD
jgi:hypothetical protein